MNINEVIVSFIAGIISNLLTNYIWGKVQKPPDPIKPGVPPGYSLGRQIEIVGYGLSPLGYVIAALYFVSNRWPLDPLESAVIVVASFIIGILILAVGFIANLRFFSVMGLILTLLVGFLVALVLFYFANRNLPNFVSLECQTKVSERTKLRGRIIDPHGRVYLVVSRKDGNKEKCDEATLGKDGVWHAYCSFNGPQGEPFGVIAYAFPSNWPGFADDKPSEEWIIKNAPWKSTMCEPVK